MDSLALLLLFTCCTTAHLVMAAVLAVFARYKVQYLALTWIMGIFTAILAIVTPYHDYVNGNPGILHPLMLLSLSGTSFLQSIYPLSIPMPAYLQWGRMWKYALPAICLYVLYGGALLLGYTPIHLAHTTDLLQHWNSPDIWLRAVAFGLCLYYVVNVLRLPSKLVHNAALPRYLKGYCLALGGSVLFYLVMTIAYTPQLLVTYLIIFTLLNLYLCFRTLETMAIHLPKPTLGVLPPHPIPVPEEPTKEEVEEEDFNEANRMRFERVECWMQQHREEWTLTSFKRDTLCEAVGLNRHLLLQCLRSQGYNDTHEYLNTYRCEELKRLIRRGTVKSVSESSDAGFGTSKTARSVFHHIVGVPLDEYLAQHKTEDTPRNTLNP